MDEKLQEASDQPELLCVENVCKSFERQPVLDKISFRLAAGEGLCIYGANGAGKTTLLRIIAGLLSPDEGAIEVCGSDLQANRMEVKTTLGVVFHRNMVYPQLTAAENLLFFARLYGLKNPQRRVEELLEQMHLSDCSSETTHKLSHGITRRLAIARALIHNPTVLLADEPFAGLDEKARTGLIQTLRNFREKDRAMVLTTHNLDSAQHCCNLTGHLAHQKLTYIRSRTSEQLLS
ncbi:MAG: heme ABC exporter ATP-binding protein CcmA [Sedimentisphaerales bacterium]|nr:heme ABC exporter ATP-binding protein CcmA [Sedimentisphaerales bacterium]